MGNPIHFLLIALLLLITAAHAEEKPARGGLNPDVSVIIDGAAGYWQRKPTSLAGDDPQFSGNASTPGGGFTLQEAELGFSAQVDPTLKGDLFLAMPNGESPEIEEGFLTTTSLPYDLQVKAGKFRSFIGRQNGQHLHVQDFTRRPLINQNFLGVDGLSSPGAQVTWLAPLPFYTVFGVEAFSVKPSEDTEAPVQSFGGGDTGDLTATAALKSFFPLDEDNSLYLGLNYAQGKSSTALDSVTGLRAAGNGLPTRIYGADVYFKFKPANVKGGYHSLVWQTEYFRRFFSGDDQVQSQSDGGIYSQIVYQLARQWYLGFRLDILGVPTSQFVANTQRTSGSITYGVTEFSRWRLYAESERVSANLASNSSPETSQAYILQYEFSYGAHGAHPF